MLRISKEPKYIKQHWLNDGQICGESRDQSVKVILEVSKGQYVPATDYYILCTLHVYNDICRQKNGELLPLSCYWIQKRSEIINDDDADDDEVNASHTNMFDIMKLQKSLKNESIVFTYNLNGRIILDAVKEERDISLGVRRALLEKLNINFPPQGSCQAEGKQEKSVLCLGFTAFEKHKNNDNFIRITQTEYSKSFAIDHKMNLDYIIPQYGVEEGGDEVALFLNFNKFYKKAIVKVFEIDSETNRRVDIGDIKILQKNENRSRNIFLNNKTIVFTTPPLPKILRNKSRHQTKMVFIEVYFPNTKETSNSTIFSYYQPTNVSKQPLPSKSTCGNTITIYDAAKPLVKVTIVTPTSDWIIINDKYANDFQQNFGDIFKSFVHIVPQFSQCIRLSVEVDNGYKEDVPQNVVILSETIELRFREKNDLISQPMLACTANSASEISIEDALDVATDFFIKYKNEIKTQESKKRLFPAAARTIDYVGYYIQTLKKEFRPMLDASCSIVETDLHENTVLHSAIALKHTKCIGQFIEMFTNYTEYPKSHQEELKELFSVYNAEGHTVLHTAVLNNMEDLVKVMLEFCQKNKINVEDYGNSVSDDSIQDLAVKSGLPNMADLVLRYIPGVGSSKDDQQVEEADLEADGK